MRKKILFGLIFSLIVSCFSFFIVDFQSSNLLLNTQSLTNSGEFVNYIDNDRQQLSEGDRKYLTDVSPIEEARERLFHSLPFHP